jgi:Glutaredoxin-like domain (DUF836)
VPDGSSEPGIGRGARPGSDAARVVVLVRHGCHLCDDAVSAVSTICSGLDVPWQAVDVDADPVLRARYSDHVPVTLVDGVQLAIWFLDPDALRAALT